MRDQVCFRNIRGGILKIEARALLRMRSFIQDQPEKTEAGGVLLGRFIVGSQNVVVDEVTVPMSGDRRSRFKFFRRAKHHQAIIDHVWAQSRHRCNYLGGWHTHAEPVPSFSGIDVSDWKRALSTEQFDAETLYFIIIGTKEMCAWEGVRDSCRVSQLEQVPPLET